MIDCARASMLCMVCQYRCHIEHRTALILVSLTAYKCASPDWLDIKIERSLVKFLSVTSCIRHVISMVHDLVSRKCCTTAQAGLIMSISVQQIEKTSWLLHRGCINDSIWLTTPTIHLQ